MSFDEQPDDPHGECRDEIKRLEAEAEEWSARVVVLRREYRAKIAEVERISEQRHDSAVRWMNEAGAEKRLREEQAARERLQRVRDPIVAAALDQHQRRSEPMQPDSIPKHDGPRCPFCAWEVGCKGPDEWWCHSCERGWETVAVFPAEADRVDLAAHAEALQAQVDSLKASLTEPTPLPEGARVEEQNAEGQTAVVLKDGTQVWWDENTDEVCTLYDTEEGDSPIWRESADVVRAASHLMGRAVLSRAKDGV